MSENETVRQATREDVPFILDLIKELADYENEPDKVLATEESLLKTLTFAPSSNADAEQSHEQPTSSDTTPQSVGYAKALLLIAQPENEVAGLALYFYNYSTWRGAPGIYLEDLFVKQKYRRRGYGLTLLQTLAKEVEAVNGGRLEWACLKWNEPSLKFYRSLGAQEMNEWVSLRVDGDALKRLAEGSST